MPYRCLGAGFVRSWFAESLNSLPFTGYIVDPPKAELRARFAGFWCPDNHPRRSCGHLLPGFGARTTTQGGSAGTFCRVSVPGQPPKADLRARFPGFWCPDNHLRRICGHGFQGFGARTTTRGGVAGTFCRVLVPGQPPKADLRARFARFWCPDHLGRSCGHVFPGYRVRTTT
jgi:hypothetical protein